MRAIPKNIADILKIYGFSVVEQLNDWDTRERFFVYKLEKDHIYYVLKIANDSFERDLNNEVWWNSTLVRLTEADPSIKVLAPQIDMSGKQFYIGEFFEAKPLIADGFNFTTADIEPWLEQISKLLVDFDQMAIQPRMNDQAQYEDTNSAPYTNLTAKLDAWMKLPLENKQIDEATIKKGKQLFDIYKASVTPRLQHGDFVPWHMYDLNEGIIGLIDGEHASLTKPRFYDLAYIYSRLATRLNDFEAAQNLLTKVIDQLDEDRSEIEKAWIPIMTLRAFGMINDAEADLKTLDYRPTAKQLLNMCFEEKITAFIGDQT